MSHLQLVALVVRDYDPAIRFFVDVLQFELVEDAPSLTNDGRPKRWVVVRPHGGQTGILLARADGEDQGSSIGRQFAGRVGMFLRVDDFDAFYQRMLAAGVQFVSAPRVEPYGPVAVFLDLEGNRWDLLGRDPRLQQPVAKDEVGMTAKGFRRIALGMTGAVEGAHMGHPDFRVGGRIFATLGYPDAKWGMVALTPEQQQDALRDHDGFSPAKGAWGVKGATMVRLAAMDEETLGAALTEAWQNAVAKSPTKRPAAKRKTPRR